MQISILLSLVTVALAQPVKLQASGETTAEALGLDPAGWFTKYGYPGPILKENLVTKEAYISAPNYQTRNPWWVVEHLTKDLVARRPDVGSDKEFYEDEAIPEPFRARLQDYKGSGYDRGHQAAAGDVGFSQKAKDETYYLSNMAPQVGAGFNQNYWSHIEEFTRRLTNTYDTVRVLTGPLYLPKAENGGYTMEYKVLGNPPNIHVPTHFFKVIVGEKESSSTVEAAAFVVPNEKIENKTPLTSFQKDFQELTSISGLNIMTDVSGVQVKNLCEAVKCRAIAKT